MRIDAGLAYQRERLTEAFQHRSHQEIAGELDQVCIGRLGADDERLLADRIEQRPATGEHRIGAAGDDEELGGSSSVRPPEHRRSDIGLPGITVRLGETL